MLVHKLNRFIVVCDPCFLLPAAFHREQTSWVEMALILPLQAAVSLLGRGHRLKGYIGMVAQGPRNVMLVPICLMFFHGIWLFVFAMCKQLSVKSMYGAILVSHVNF